MAVAARRVSITGGRCPVVVFRQGDDAEEEPSFLHTESPGLHAGRAGRRCEGAHDVGVEQKAPPSSTLRRLPAAEFPIYWNCIQSWGGPTPTCHPGQGGDLRMMWPIYGNQAGRDKCQIDSATRTPWHARVRVPWQAMRMSWPGLSPGVKSRMNFGSEAARTSVMWFPCWLVLEHTASVSMAFVWRARGPAIFITISR